MSIGGLLLKTAGDPVLLAEGVRKRSRRLTPDDRIDWPGGWMPEPNGSW